jgi:transcriptional regulator of acetoin/glycerol metabolism
MTSPSSTTILDSEGGGLPGPLPLHGRLPHRSRAGPCTEFEKRYLEHVIRRANGNISDAARIGGVDRTTLYRLMEKHGTHRDNILDD